MLTHSIQRQLNKLRSRVPPITLYSKEFKIIVKNKKNTSREMGNKRCNDNDSKSSLSK